jgi:multidrug efflux pump subunit AcrA (membrane-fusion protein)
VTPEVRQNRLAIIRRSIELGHVGGNEDTEWLLEDVERLEALLLQRAQEIAELRAELVTEREKHDEEAYDDAMTEIDALKTLLTARAQEIEPVKALSAALVERLGQCSIYGPADAVRDLATRIHIHADAALVSRAPQPEQE